MTVTRWFECAACSFPVKLLHELNGVDEALDCGSAAAGHARQRNRLSRATGDDSQESNIRLGFRVLVFGVGSCFRGLVCRISITTSNNVLIPRARDRAYCLGYVVYVRHSYCSRKM